VKAKDKATGKEQSIRIEARSGLSEADIERMKKDAEAHAADDAKKRELVEAKNQAEQAIYAAEKALRDHADKIPEDVKKSVQDAVKNVSEHVPKDDVAAIKSATEALVRESMKIGEAVQKAGAGANGETPKAEGAADGPVRDTEATDKKPDEEPKA
jgi:molecular chaperone DnaK